LPSGLSALPESVPIHLAPHGHDHAGYTLQLRRRGLHVIPAVRLQSVDPLGLQRLETQVPERCEVLVYPRVLPLPTQFLPATTGGGRAPLESTHRQGEGSSFMGVREYRPGDPLRHVHWRTAARLGRLAVVEWEAEESVDALIAVETLEGTDLPLRSGSTLDLAAGLAASLISRILANGDSVRLLAPGATQWGPTPAVGLATLPGFLDTLARMQPIASVSLAAELTRVVPQLASGTLIAWITPGLDEAVVEAARMLRGARMRPMIYLLSTVSAGEDGPWRAGLATLQSYGVPVIVLYPEDDLVTRLMD